MGSLTSLLSGSTGTSGGSTDTIAEAIAGVVENALKSVLGNMS